MGGNTSGSVTTKLSDRRNGACGDLAQKSQRNRRDEVQGQTHGGNLQGKPHRKQYFLVVQQFAEHIGSRLWAQPVFGVNGSGLVGLEERQKRLDFGVLLRAFDHRRDHFDGIVIRTGCL